MWLDCECDFYLCVRQRGQQFLPARILDGVDKFGRTLFTCVSWAAVYVEQQVVNKAEKGDVMLMHVAQRRSCQRELV